MRTFARGEAAALGGVFYAVMLSTLDDAGADELASAPIHFANGRNDRFEETVSDTRNL